MTFTARCPNDGNKYITTETGWYCGHCGATFWDIYGELKELKNEKTARKSEIESGTSVKTVPGNEGL